jgi:hypothetical protein
MSATIERTFTSRREADLAVERLVQEHGFERTDIFVSAEGNANSAGDVQSNDGAANGPILVSIDLDDESRSDLVESVFNEFDAG